MALNTCQNLSANEEDDQKRRYHIIWLDKNINNATNKRRVQLIHEIDPNKQTFIDETDCIDYVRKHDAERKVSHIILIISGSLSESVIPKIQNYTCLFAIFIYCANFDNYKHLKYRKLRAICTDANELIDNIDICITKYNDTTDFSVFSSQQPTHSDSVSSEDGSRGQSSIRNLKEDQASFLWFRQMHEFMITLENDDDEKAKEEMISHCREQKKGNSDMQRRIDEFNHQSWIVNKEKAIFSYTANSFIHECTNLVLRKENISQVYSYRYIIKLICQQLKQLHQQFLDEYKKQEQKSSLRVYRGQYLKADQIELLTKNIKNLISLNGFVSTSRNKDIAMDFIRNRWQGDFEPVLFRIDVDMTSEHSVAFADVSKLSRFPQEEEVLLSIGSVFLVKSVKLVDLDGQLKINVIDLSLSQRNQLTVISYIEQTYANNVDSTDRAVLFGKLLFDMGECDAAIKYFLDALDRLSDNNNQLRATYMNNIGVCYAETKRNDDALKYYKGAMRIYEQTRNKRGLSACQHNVANIYHTQGDHQTALRWALEAFDTRQNDKLEKASTLDLLGCIYLALSDVDASSDHFEQALQIRSECLGRTNPNHPDIGISYHNLGKVLERMARHSEAKTNYSQAAEIYRHNYSRSHPLVKQISKCLKESQ